VFHSKTFSKFSQVARRGNNEFRDCEYQSIVFTFWSEWVMESPTTIVTMKTNPKNDDLKIIGIAPQNLEIILLLFLLFLRNHFKIKNILLFVVYVKELIV
jgi:hypothetical protein